MGLDELVSCDVLALFCDLIRIFRVDLWLCTFSHAFRACLDFFIAIFLLEYEKSPRDFVTYVVQYPAQTGVEGNYSARDHKYYTPR